MSIATWLVSGILAGMFGMAGIMKSFRPIDKLLKSGITWANRFPASTVRVVGISELLGAIGLVLPWAVNVAPVLTPVAASALALVMLLAIFHHIKHKEYTAIILNGTLLILTAFVAYARFKSL